MAERIYTDDFKVKVLDSPIPVIVDFYSDSCIACKKLAPTLCDVEEDYEDKVKIYKVNTGYDPKLVEEYGILSNPTLILFKDGEILDKQIGAKDYDEISDWIDSLI